MNKELFQPELRITQVTFDNFRGFEHLELQLQPNLNVLIGENGAGKTAILDGIAKLLITFASDLLPPDSEYQQAKKSVLDSSDMRKGKGELEIFLELSLGDDRALGVDVICRNKQILPGTHNYLHNFSYAELRERYSNQQPLNLPLPVYFPASNAPVNPISFKDTPEDFETHIFTAYDGALDKRAFDFTKFFTWYRWQENIEKQLGQNLVLKVIRQAIYNILNDDHNQFDKLAINWLNGPTGEMLIEKNGVALNINQLSSGEKTLLALVADCSRRLALANPHRDNPLLGYGVVLIDEVDLHLHPRWQRRLIPKLQQTFPNCQLIVTTHSPLVLSYVPRENVMVLKDFQILHTTPYTFGRDANSILFELMGVKQRPEEMQRQLDLVYELMEEGKKAEAFRCLEELSKSLGHNDSAIVRAYSHLDFMDDTYEAN